MGDRALIAFFDAPDLPPRDILWTQYQGRLATWHLRNALRKLGPKKWSDPEAIIDQIEKQEPGFHLSEYGIPDHRPIYVLPSEQVVAYDMHTAEPFEMSFSKFVKLPDEVMDLLGQRDQPMGDYEVDHEFTPYMENAEKFWKDNIVAYHYAFETKKPFVPVASPPAESAALSPGLRWLVGGAIVAGGVVVYNQFRHVASNVKDLMDMIR